MLNSIRYFGMNDFAEIDRMTLHEYNMRMTAYQLKQADRECEIYLQAWTNREINAKKKSGKKRLVPIYKTFKQFFDLEKRIKEILRPDERISISAKSQGIYDLMKKQKERRLNGGNL